MADLLLCYNKGCGQKYDPEKNKEDCCTHHPGVPVFHDAYKGWSCCSKKTTDFTEFLNIKGCTKSCHSNEKPPEPEKPEVKEEPKPDVVIVTAARPPTADEIALRPSEDTPMKKLTSNVGASLVPMLENLKISSGTNASNASLNKVGIGTSCKNNGCKETYKGEASNRETCVFHSGIPIFHEGMKFWSCCQRKTSDFDSFMEQAGCSTGTHIWIKKSLEDRRTDCRYDWHQTGSYVCVTLYCKVPIPEQCCIEASPVKLNAHIIFGEERSIFDLMVILQGVIDVEKSSVQYLGTKVEIKLKKAEPQTWAGLEIPRKKVFVEDESVDDLKDL